MSFRNWLISLLNIREFEDKQKTISELQRLIEKQQEIIKEQNEHPVVTSIPNQQQEEIIEGLKKEVNRYQDLIKTYEESANKLNVQLEEIRLMYQNERLKVQEVTTQLDKEREKVSNLEKELSKGTRIPKELKEEIEKKTSLIREYEKSAKTLKNNFEEISNRYHEASENYEKEKQNAIRLEMMILDMDKELGLTDIAEKMKPKEEETLGIMITNSK
ncbi:MAG: hypothetical protein WC556_08835 [Candidatus Methanoperedens sp.]